MIAGSGTIEVEIGWDLGIEAVTHTGGGGGGGLWNEILSMKILEWKTRSHRWNRIGTDSRV